MKRFAVAALLAATLLAGCVPTGPSAREATEAFFSAVNDGDASAAIALTTSRPSDFACTEFEPNLAAVKIGDVVENGDTAVAKVSYAVFGEPVSESVKLSQQNGEWLVVLPDSYRITVPIEQDVVVEATFEDECTIRPVDGTIELLALPGAYSVTIDDPTGVFSVSALGFVAVPDASTAVYVEGFEVYIDQQDRDIVANLLQVGIDDAVIACIGDHFAGSTCPDGIPAGDLDQDIARYPDIYPDAARAVDIFSPDGETWHFTTNEAILRIQQGGALTDVPFSYSGVITVADNGDLVPVFD